MSFSDVKNLTNIYFIQSIIGGPIKIGHSRDMERRLHELQKNSPFDLKIVRLIKDIPDFFEKSLHRKFKKYHIRDEWFSEEVLDIADKFLKDEQNRRSAKIPMPGDVLEKKMNEFGINNQDLSERTGISVGTLYRLRVGKAKFNWLRAKKISQILGTEPSFWIDIQKEYHSQFTSKHGSK